jgi:hypothetical protein
MAFFNPALQTTFTLCGLPIVLISCLITLTTLVFQRRRGKNLTPSTGITCFLLVLSLCFVASLVANWLFLLVAVENIQS